MIKNYSHRLAALLVALLTTVASMAAGITLNLRKVTVKKAMERIENVSNVRFFYKDNLKDLNKRTYYCEKVYEIAVVPIT